MGLSNLQYNTIIRGYEETQNRNRHRLEERVAYVYAHVPGYRKLDDDVASVSVAQGKKYLDGDENALDELKEILKALSAAKKQLLADHSIVPDYLEPLYDCPYCQDTGYHDGVKCHCFKQSIITLLYEQSGIQEMMKSENFSTLSYNYYQGEDLSRFKNAVSACQDFIKNFRNDYQNLFFYGTVGTGKSFLSGCIAQTLIEEGESVIYFSAAGLFEALSHNMYNYKNSEPPYDMHGDLYGCDLLIIDDLGTEMTNSFVATQLFSCLNERHMARQSTIVSTNLSLAELKDRYSERIFSRISSNYQLYKLTGPDIRMIKKREENLRRQSTSPKIS